MISFFRKKKKSVSGDKRRIEKWDRLKKLFLPVVLFAITLILLFFAGRKLVVKEVVCTQSTGGCDEILNKRLSSAAGLSPIRSKEKVGQILEEQNTTKFYKITYSFPYKVNVYIEKRVPEYATSGKPILSQLRSAVRPLR